MTLCVGEIVRTNYGTGPYRVVGAYGPCQCPKYLDWINQGQGVQASEPHFDLVCVDADARSRPGKDLRSYLNGYRRDGTSIWNDDFLIFESVPKGVTLDLFAVYDFRARENGGCASE